MGTRNTIFGSNGEESGFRHIKHNWGEKFSLYPQLPFSVIFEPDDTIRDTSNLFYKTSVDYTLCTKAGKPLLAIDFDGLGHGFNRHDQYVKVRETKDRFRKLKFDFKLRYAKRYGFPYYVISYDEFEPIGESTRLAIVDGIIGQEIAHQHLPEKVTEALREREDLINSLPPSERDDYIQDLVIGEEVISVMEHDPIAQKVSQIYYELEGAGCTAQRWGYQFIEEPALPDVEYNPQSPFPTIPTLESVKQRLAAMHNIMRIGCVFSLETSVGKTSVTAWMRNVGDYGRATMIVENVAKLIAYTKTLRIARKNLQNPSNDPITGR